MNRYEKITSDFVVEAVNTAIETRLVKDMKIASNLISTNRFISAQCEKCSYRTLDVHGFDACNLTNITYYDKQLAHCFPAFLKSQNI